MILISINFLKVGHLRTEYILHLGKPKPRRIPKPSPQNYGSYEDDNNDNDNSLIHDKILMKLDRMVNGDVIYRLLMDNVTDDIDIKLTRFNVIIDNDTDENMDMSH